MHPIPKRTARFGGKWGCTLEVKTQNDPLLTEQQASEFLGVKPGTLQVWRCNKRYPLAYVKVGRNVRYRQSAIEAFMAVRTVEA
jgi:predicted DNA-binding transcriptional regulator AlpA